MAWLQNLTTSLLFESTNVSNSVGECQADKTYETVGLLSFQYNDNYCQNSQLNTWVSTGFLIQWNLTFNISTTLPPQKKASSQNK